MIPYIILIVFLAYLAFVGKTQYWSLRLRRIGVTSFAIILILFQGLRHFSVGTDTSIYLRRFAFVDSTDDIWRSMEIGYNSLNVFLSLNFDSFNVLLISISAFVVSAYTFGIVRMTKYYALALFLFVALGTYTFSFNAARQGMAVAVCFLALPFLLRRRAKHYFFMILFAASFHQTAIVAAPLYFLTTASLSWRYLAWIVVATLIMTVGLTSLVQLSATLLNDSYSAYAEEHVGGGEVTVLFLFTQAVFLYLLKPMNNENESYYSRLLSIYLIGLVPALASVLTSVNPSGVLRLQAYFSHVAILLWPLAISQIKNANLRSHAAGGLVLFMLTYFYMSTSTFSRLTPYRMYFW